MVGKMKSKMKRYAAIGALFAWVLAVGAASLDTLIIFTALNNVPPTTRFATIDSYVDGSTPTQEWAVLDFDDAAGGSEEFADFTAVMPGQYDGSSALEAVIFWSTDYTTAGNVKWDGAWKRIADDADDTDSTAFATIQSATCAKASAAGEVDYCVIDFTNAQADGIQPNELFTFRLERDTGDAADTVEGVDAELHAIELRLN
jgi:hypothetical protein